MLKRLLMGLVEGVLLGSVLALLLVKGLGVATITGVVAYLAAIVTGLLTGLVAGRPIWQRDARIEAGLKAIAGAALGALALWALRRWVGAEADLSALGMGSGKLVELPAVMLPLVATVLALLFELDNTAGAAPEAKVRAPSAPARIDASESHGELEELESEPKHAERRLRR